MLVVTTLFLGFRPWSAAKSKLQSCCNVLISAFYRSTPCSATMASAASRLAAQLLLRPTAAAASNQFATGLSIGAASSIEALRLAAASSSGAGGCFRAIATSAPTADAQGTSDGSGGSASRPSSAADPGATGPQQQSHRFDPRDGTSFSRNEMPSDPTNKAPFDADGKYGGHPPNEHIKRDIESGDRTYHDFWRDGMPRPGEYVVRELDEQGREVGATGPDPNAPKGSIWYKQEMEHAMAAASPEPPNYERMEAMDRRQPGDPGGVDPNELRPKYPADTDDMVGGWPGYVGRRAKEVAAGAWETLKHGVNNAGQPQVVEELKATAPDPGTEAAARRQPHSTASVGDTGLPEQHLKGH